MLSKSLREFRNCSNDPRYGLGVYLDCVFPASFAGLGARGFTGIMKLPKVEIVIHVERWSIEQLKKTKSRRQVL